MVVIFNTLDTLSIGGYVLSLSPPKTSKSNKLYFDFQLNCGIESLKCVCFDPDKHPFFKVSMDILTWEHISGADEGGCHCCQ